MELLTQVNLAETFFLLNPKLLLLLRAPNDKNEEIVCLQQEKDPLGWISPCLT